MRDRYGCLTTGGFLGVVIERPGSGTYRLTASQVLPVGMDAAFSFFEDPLNLFQITPDWLDFRMVDPASRRDVYEGAEFDYTIRWFGLRFRWRGRIEGYMPPREFTDVQVRGPYRDWSHLHSFDACEGGTRMDDTVTYTLPFGPVGSAVLGGLIRRQLEDIFCYRAARIGEWATGGFRKKGPGNSPA